MVSESEIMRDDTQHVQSKFNQQMQFKIEHKKPRNLRKLTVKIDPNFVPTRIDDEDWPISKAKQLPFFAAPSKCQYCRAFKSNT